MNSFHPDWASQAGFFIDEEKGGEKIQRQARLRVIASSPNSLQRMLDVVARNAARLCEASDALIVRVDGNSHIPVASYGALAPTHGILTSRGSPAGRAILDRQTLHIHDLAVEVETEFPEVSEFQKRLGDRSMLATPLLRDGIAVGEIGR